MNDAANAPQRPSSLALWARRHPKRLLAIALATSLALFIGLIGVIAYAVFASMKQSAPYQEAVARARAHPALIEAMGQPIDPTWLMSGEIQESYAYGRAEFSIPLRGPKARAELEVKARKSEGDWEYLTMSATVEGRAEPIDLLEHAAPRKVP